MRKLKFRLWSENQNKYVDATFVIVSTEGELFSLDEDYVIEQYTGLKDKNGKEIYEGDILRLTRKVARDKSTLYQVVWNEHIAGFDTKNLDENGWDIGYLNETAAEKDYLVIGNVHEDKELLEGEE